MDAIDLIRFQSRQAWAWLSMTVEDVTEEQANWQPPGLANSIAATYAHTIITADEDFNMVYDGGETLLARGWAERCGLSELPPPEFGWDWHGWATRVRADWAAFRQRSRRGRIGPPAARETQIARRPWRSDVGASSYAIKRHTSTRRNAAFMRC